jgi:hypothetical protein
MEYLYIGYLLHGVARVIAESRKLFVTMRGRPKK